MISRLTSRILFAVFFFLFAMYHHARHAETTKTKTKTKTARFRPILGTVEVLTLGTNSARVTPRLER